MGGQVSTHNLIPSRDKRRKTAEPKGLLLAGLRGIGREYVPNGAGEIVFENTGTPFSALAHVTVGDHTYSVRVTQTR